MGTSRSPIKAEIVSLGCPKNLVDSELMLGLLARSGIELTDGREAGDFVLVNTCSFIREAREESMETIRGLSASSRNGRKLVVAGCLVSHLGRELLEALPEVDAFIHPSAMPDVAHVVMTLLKGDLEEKFVRRDNPVAAELPRMRLTSGHTAYVRIADGCDNRCSYCTVPSIRGPFRSRAPGAVEDEVRRLVNEGVVEINLIAQDSTLYGKDLHGARSLAALLRRLCAIEGLKWLRLLYAHPAHFDGELIETFRREPELCRYVDLPIQHVSDRILASMGRGVTSSRIHGLVTAIREKVVGAALRTTVIVGYPGETDGEFGELMDFISEARVERLGAFAYSSEAGTAAALLPDQVDERVKTERLSALMSLQQGISREFNESLLGTEVDVLVDASFPGGDYCGVGRTERDAPEVDGRVYLTGRHVRPGEIVRVTVIGADEYDLTGEVHVPEL